MSRRLYRTVKQKGLALFHRIQNGRIQKSINGLIMEEDFLRINNQKPQKVSKVAFVIPDMIPYGGGITSILRIGNYLSKQGLHVIYISYGQQEKSQMERIGQLNYPGCQGEFFGRLELDRLKECDVIVATSWKSVYVTKKYPAYKLYFIQDYEPYFHDFGELHLLAKKTYELGYHMITLGAWNRYMIEKECQLKKQEKIDAIDFPYENKEYSFKERDFESYKTKKQFTLAVYIKDTPRRLPNLIQVMMKNLADCFEKEGRSLNVKFYGLDKKQKVLTGENLGKLSKKELEALYHQSDFGMVASFSNISLVPYEMLATGLPIIEFADGTFPFFFGEHAAILTNGSYIALYEQMKNCIEEPEKLLIMQENALKVMKHVSWTKTCQQFYDIVKSLER